MASEIKVDNIKDQCGTAVITKCGATHTVTAEVYKADTIQDTSGNAYLAKCGTTVTLGGCGQTIALAAGASQSGFGRTGTVDWDTTAKTAAFTAVSGNGYFVDTTSAAITVTLPASPSAGDIVYIKDYTGTFGTNTCTVARNGSNIRGATNNFTLKKSNAGAAFIYVDATEGWQVFVDGSDSDAQPTFITATGGTITCCGNYKIHTFTGPGTFCVSSTSCCAANNEISYMVVAGGAGGGGFQGGGGGGAGGFREFKSSVDCYSASPLEGSTPITVTATAFPITVGGGGAGGPGSPSAPNPGGSNGANSTFSTITSAGGGGGGRGGGPCGSLTGSNGGSGGAGGGRSGNSGGSGNTPPVSPPQGNNGGTSKPEVSPSIDSGGGGGGATAVGANGQNDGNPAGNGGAGATTSISGSPTTYAGGGGGARETYTSGTGGTGGGGAGGPGVGNNGTANTGGGAGGGNADGGTGGSGIVIIRYKYQ